MSEHGTGRDRVADGIRKAMQHLNRSKGELAKRAPIPFAESLRVLYRLSLIKTPSLWK